MQRIKSLTLVIAALLVGSSTAAAAQSQAYSGAFAQHYPDAATLLNGFDAVHAELFEQLFTNTNVTSLEGTTYDEFANEMLQGARGAIAMEGEMPRFSQRASRLAQVLDWAEVLRNDLYDIYADPSVTDKYAAGEAAIDRYLARTDLALPPVARDMMLLQNEVYPNAFYEGNPHTKGLIWASHWLQLAVLDPMMYYDDASAQADGVQKTVDRFKEMIANAPDGLPSSRPTPAAISPELVRTHPRAAKIFDNVGKIHDAVADILIDREVTDKQAALNGLLGRFMDPNRMEASDYDWVVMSLRGGIFYQGGPAIGRLDRPERNMGHGHGEMGVMPGMPMGTTGGGGGGGGSAPMPNDGNHADH